jgi:hypothetical protein
MHRMPNRIEQRYTICIRLWRLGKDIRSIRIVAIHFFYFYFAYREDILFVRVVGISFMLTAEE